MPDSVNPVEWWKETREAISPMKTPAQRAAEEAGKRAGVPGGDKPFPNLASVPKRPIPADSAAGRRAMDGLRRDWGVSHAQDYVVRTQEANLVPPSEPEGQRPPALVPSPDVALGGSAAPEKGQAPRLIQPRPRPPAPPRTARRVAPEMPPPPPARMPAPPVPAPPVIVDPGVVPPPPVIEAVPEVPPPPPLIPERRSELGASQRIVLVNPANVRLVPPSPSRATFVKWPRVRRQVDAAGFQGGEGLLWLAGGMPGSMQNAARRLRNPPKPKNGRFTPPPKPGTAKFGEPPADIAAAVESKPAPEPAPAPKPAPAAKPVPKTAVEPAPKAAPKTAPAPRPQVAKVDEEKAQRTPTKKAAPSPGQIAVPLDREKNAKGRMGVVLFDFGSASLNATGQKVINDIVTRHGQIGGKLRVIGHASGRTAIKDPVAHRMANFSMSLDRANAVAQALIKRGISPELVSVTAMADSQPAFSEQNKAGVARNQRTEIYIDPIETVDKP